jgi:cob(I)alamin adenosyltransferase
LPEASVDDFHPRITQGAGDDFRAAIVSIEAGLGDEHTNRNAHGYTVQIIERERFAAPRSPTLNRVTPMSQDAFNEPRIALNRIYTRMGDAGETRLVGGQKIAKDDPRIECYGTVDELNSFLGAARATAEELRGRHERLRGFVEILKRVQHELFNLGSILATLPEDVHAKQPRITAAEVAQLEREVDEANAELEPLRSFVLPGGSRLDAELHICRTVCRRAERLLVSLAKQQNVDPETVRYLNRLSDALFVWSRWVNRVLGAEETLWQPNAAAASSADKK